MTGTIFWDVDTQVDFMVPGGKLYVPDAAAITANLDRLTRHARERGIPRVASVDDHTLFDPEISDTPDFRETFPPHCLHGTDGQKKIPATAMASPVVVPNRPEITPVAYRVAEKLTMAAIPATRRLADADWG